MQFLAFFAIFDAKIDTFLVIQISYFWAFLDFFERVKKTLRLRWPQQVRIPILHIKMHIDKLGNKMT